MGFIKKRRSFGLIKKIRINSWVCIILSLALVFSNFTGLDLGMAEAHAEVQLQGDGTSSAPYEISDYNMLKEFADIVNGTNGHTSQPDAWAILTADIVCTDKEWKAMGYENSEEDYVYYTGRFNGQNKKIIGLSNVDIDDIDSKSYQGLFGYNSGEIINVGLQDTNIKGSSHVGGVAGDNEGTITDCYNTGAVSGYSGVGGVAGYNEGTITDCYNAGEISGLGDVGGVAGNNNETITGSYNTGAVSGDSCVGGVSGYNKGGSITDCYNTGDVAGRGEYVGGVTGYNDIRSTINGNITGTVTNSYNTGAVTGQSDLVGGVVGGNGGPITKCYNLGAVSGQNGVGGVAGANNENITNSYNTGSVKGQSNVGGMAGKNRQNITSCYNTGSVKGQSNVGGVSGLNNGAYITNSYNTGAVTGQSDVGGVVGSNYSYSITNSYNIGVVTGLSNVGGVAGRSNTGYDNSLIIEHCFYDTSICTGINAIGVNNANINDVHGYSTDVFTGEGSNNPGIEFTVNGDPWLYKDNDDNNYFYPHLKDVNFDGKNSGADVDVKDWPARRLKENGGSENSPYEISDYNILKQFSDIVNGINENTPNQDIHAILTADIVCTDRLWKPIGTYNNSQYFRLSFNGQGHKIIGLSNVDIDDIDNKDYQGLFGYIIANIENVGLQNTSIRGRDYIGAVVGYKYAGKIKKCYNTGTVSGQDYVGGIVGRDFQGLPEGISKCYNTGAVSGQSHVGGVAGYNDYIITECYNIGAVTGQYIVGGVVGENFNTIINCYFDKEKSNVLIAIDYGNTSVTAIGLTTAQMTGTNALTNMSLSADDWITKADYVDADHFVWYYPHLKGFDRKADGTVETDSSKIVDWPAYREGLVEFNEPASYEYCGSAIYPTSKIVLGDDTVPTEILAEYKKYVYDRDTSTWTWSSISESPTEPGTYRLSYTTGDNNTVEKFFYIWGSSHKYSKKTGENTWEEIQTENSINVGTYRLVTKDNSERITFTKYFKITPKTVTVTANSAEKTYGESDPALAYSTSGLLTIDSASGSLTRAAGEDASTYAIRIGSLDFGSNYIVDFTGADFTINPRPVTVTANTGEKTYGEVDPELTFSTSGFVNSDSASGSLFRVAGENAGTYDINQGSLAVGSNYTMNFTGSSFTINPKNVTVTANSAEKTYGDADPELTFSTSGLVNNDSVSGSLTRAAGEDAGTYAINQGTLTVGNNYTMSFSGSSFTINPKALNNELNNITIELSYESITYDGTEKEPTVTVKDGVNTVASDEYLVTYSDNVNAGTATVTVTDKDGGNYIVSGTKTFVIHKALTGIDTAPSVVTGLIYNGKAQALVASGTAKDNLKVVYALGSDSVNIPAADAEGTPDEQKIWKETVPSATEAGTYYVWYKVAVDGNHSLGNDEAVCLPVTIAKAAVTVTAENKTKNYGTADAQLTATINGLAEGDSSDLIVYSLSRVSGENVGTYSITATGENVQGNYTVSFVPGVFTITTSTETDFEITLYSDTFVYDGTAKKPGVKVENKGKEIPASEYTVTYSDNINAGTAKVVISDVAGGNFAVSGSKTFTITKAAPVYDLPSGLTGTKGDKLSSIALPNGWSWKDGNTELSEAGSKVYKAIYAPADTANYITVEDVDVTVTIIEPSNVDPDPSPDPTPDPTPDPKPDPTPAPAQEPVVEKPTLPPNTTVVENEDGTISTITLEKNKNGSVTTTTITTDAEGNFIKKEVKNENTTKSGTKVVTITTETADKTLKNEEYKEYKNGASSEKVYVYNPDGSSTYNATIVKKDGTTTVTEKKTDSEGNVQYENLTEKPDGSTVVTKNETNADGTIKSYKETTNPDGSSVVTKKETNADGSSKSYKKTTNADGSSKSKNIEKDTEGNRTTTIITTNAEGAMRASQTIVSSDGSKVVFKFTGALSSTPLGEGASSGSSSSGEGTGTSDGTMSTEYDGTFKLIAFKSDGEVIIIPSAIEEDGKLYAVESIGKKLFFNNKTITEIQIGKYVTKIEAKAFKNASNLKTIIIYAENLETVERQAFKGISNKAKFSIKAGKAKYKNVVNLIKDSEVKKSVKFKRIK